MSQYFKSFKNNRLVVTATYGSKCGDSNGVGFDDGKVKHGVEGYSAGNCGTDGSNGFGGGGINYRTSKRNSKY